MSNMPRGRRERIVKVNETVWGGRFSGSLNMCCTCACIRVYVLIAQSVHLTMELSHLNDKLGLVGIIVFLSFCSPGKLQGDRSLE